MATIEPGSFLEGDEELGAVSSWASVGHGKKVGLGVTEGKVLIFELVSVDGLTTGTVSVSEIATLSHETWDNTMEGAALEVKGLSCVANTGGAISEGGEVLDSLGDGVTEHSEYDATGILTIDSNVEENFLGDCIKGLSCEDDSHH